MTNKEIKKQYTELKAKKQLLEQYKNTLEDLLYNDSETKETSIVSIQETLIEVDKKINVLKNKIFDLAHN